MKSQACEPCAKRKVRCDKEEPCSNCKRRKQDHCSYPEETPLDKIKRLESLVRSLGGDPETEALSAVVPTEKNSQPKIRRNQSRNNVEAVDLDGAKSKDPVVGEENGQQFYLESRAWGGWLGNSQDNGVSLDTATRNPFLTLDRPHAFQGLVCGNSSVSLAARHPSQRDAATLWSVFKQRVNPLNPILFGDELKSLRTSCTSSGFESFCNAQHALVFSVYLVTSLSLTDEECRRKLRQPQSHLVSEFQALCEEAVSRSNIFSLSDITELKALGFYMMAASDRLSTQSLWSLMGLVIRNAEKFGIHRDGTLLGLSPLQTEQRRRLWWQLQHMDLGLAVRSGMTPLSMMADWDAKLPLNIEDEDIDENTIEPPVERKGLTSLSYCMFTYWVIEQQRLSFRSDNSRFALSWQSNLSLPFPWKNSLIEQLEEGLNSKFLQYCDPIKPVDTLLQLMARCLICGMRLRTLHPMVFGGQVGKTGEAHREALMAACVQALEYNVAMYSQPSIRNFHWWTSRMFPWHAFMCILVELSQQDDTSKIEQIWELLTDLYSVNSDLSQLSDDRRVSHAAELVVTAWKAYQSKLSAELCLPKPDFVIRLESQLPEQRATATTNHGIRATVEGVTVPRVEPITPESFLAEQDMNIAFDLDFQDIDWSFWSSVD